MVNKGERFLRLQVKATLEQHNYRCNRLHYQFQLARGPSSKTHGTQPIRWITSFAPPLERRRVVVRRQQLIGCLFGVWLVFFGHTMKVLTLTTIATVAAVLTFSTGCSQSKIDALNTQLDDVRTALEGCSVDLADAREAQGVAEREMTVAQDQSETAYANLHNVQRQLAEQKKRVEALFAASKALNTRYDLKVAEYETFVAKTAQALAAKDKKISELNAELSAAQNKN